MGGSKRSAGLTHFQNHNYLLLASLFIPLLILTGCQSLATLAPTKVQIAETPVQNSGPPTETPFPTPIQTTVPSPTATQGPALVLDELDPNISYTIPLTTQWVSETSVYFHFALDKMAAGSLFYWTDLEDGAFTEVMPFGDDTLLHTVLIEGLKAETVYFATVGIYREGVYRPPMFLGGEWTPVKFTTSFSTHRPHRIGVIGDSGFGEQITYQLTSMMSALDLNFVIHTGDIVYRVEENADPPEAYIGKYFLPFSEILHEMPVFPVPGNHEYDTAAVWDDSAYYYEVFPPLPAWLPQSQEGFRQYYALPIGDIQFLFLDTQAFWMDQGGAEQTLWLAERLEDRRFSISIPILHVPPYSSGLHAKDGAIVEREWIPLFEKHNVALVLSGHDHNYQRLSVNGITYVVSGGGSSVLYSRRELHPDSVFFSAMSHFVVLTLFQDHLELEAISSEGEIIDSTVIEWEARNMIN